jgi:hypothetical protein
MSQSGQKEFAFFLAQAQGGNRPHFLPFCRLHSHHARSSIKTSETNS